MTDERLAELEAAYHPDPLPGVIGELAAEVRRLKAEAREPAALVWSTGLPSGPGWYWYRRSLATDHRAYIVDVELVSGTVVYGRVPGSENIVPIDCDQRQAVHEWAGPIPYPEQGE